MQKYTFLFGFLLSIFSFAQAQSITVFPEKTQADDSITITFHAEKGNAALKNYAGNIYMHTGVIIGTPDEPSGWRYVQGEWGKHDARMLMTKVAENTYQKRIHLRSFYGFLPEEPFLQVAMVFRSEDGSLVAKEEGNKDIFYPNIPKYVNGVLETVSGKDGSDLGDFVRLERTDNQIILKGTRRDIVLTHFSDEIVGVSFEQYRTMPKEFGAAINVLPNAWKAKIVDKNGQPIRISFGKNKEIEISRKPMRLRFLQDKKEILADELGLFEDKKENIAGLRLQLPENTQVYGTGSRAIPIDRKGERLYLYNTASYGYTGGETRLNLSIPFIHLHKIEKNANTEVALLLDNPRRAYLDMGKSEKNVLEFGVKDSALSYYVIFGENPQSIIENYTYLTGRQPLPPIWALGFMQSRFGYKSQREVEEMVEKTQKAGFPLDAILMDLYWFGELAQMGNLDWRKDSFPNPKEMIQNLDKKGVKTVLITESYFVKSSTKYAEADKLQLFTKLKDGSTAVIPDFWAGAAALLDVFNPEAQKWFWKEYRRIAKDYGNQGWWCDSGEPENHPSRMIHSIGKAEDAHNLYPLFWAKFIAENHAKDFPDTRLFNLARSGYAGVQRYSIFPWSGDVSRSWEAFRAQTQIMLGAGMSGIGYMHSDLGGFTGGPLDEELYIRWLQFGAFTPVMRAHGSNLPSEPVLFSENTQKLVKNAINLRYKLLPYNYNLAYENATKGTPLARPLYFHFPKDTIAAKIDEEYMWGADLLVCPIFQKGQTEKKIYLPEGKWFDFETYKAFEGGKWYIIPVSLEKMPVFVRAGAVIPTTPYNNTSKYKADMIVCQYFADASISASQKSLYFDDGKTPNPADNQILNISAKWENGNPTFQLSHKKAQNSKAETVIMEMPTLQKNVIFKWNGKIFEKMNLMEEEKK
jgi:alpha-glucosidase (family GH31 glycosyl hydrolase)